MPHNESHRSYMTFVSRLTDFLSDYSVRELRSFLDSASHGFPGVAPVIEACIRMVDTSAGQTRGGSLSESTSSTKPATKWPKAVEIPKDLVKLPDLLLSKELFRANQDLVKFAIRVLPGMPKRRYDKMSRDDIVAKIVDYLEQVNSRKRERLETSMRRAIDMMSAGEQKEVQSFFSQWEKIIKGIEL